MVRFPLLSCLAGAALIALAVAPLPAHAHGDAHGDAHADAHAAGAPAQRIDRPFGRPGLPARVSRVITVDMTDGMHFVPDVLTVARGQTVRLVLRNRGRLMHEMVLGTPESLRAHAEQMRRTPGMAHDEPGMAHVAPGRDGSIVWQFTHAGEFAFACLLPGHSEAGMVGRVRVRVR